jgi:hypothetical protein
VNITLKCGAITVVDDDCPHLDYPWEQIATGHAAAFMRDEQGNPSVLLLDRLIMRPGRGWVVRHKNGRPLDNRRENLALDRYYVLRARGTGANRTSKSGILGVQHIPETCPRRPWRAQIHVNDHNYHLGAFVTKEEAVAMRQAAELCFFGDLKG